MIGLKEMEIIHFGERLNLPESQKSLDHLPSLLHYFPAYQRSTNIKQWI